MKSKFVILALALMFAGTGVQASVDGMDDSVRPCIDKVKQSLNNSYVQPISEAELKQCYDGALMFDKYMTKTLPEFAAWVGVRATLEKVEEQFGRIMGLGARKNTKVVGELPKTYNGMPVIRAYELMRDFEEDEGKASEKYKNKSYVIVGTVNIVKRDPISQKVVVELQGDNLGLFNCYVYLDEHQEKAAAALNKDEVVTLSGIIKGIGTELRLEVVNGVIITGSVTRRAGQL